MGRRDYRRRESKKSKKVAKKPASPVILPSPVTVEIIKKGKRAKPPAEEE